MILKRKLTNEQDMNISIKLFDSQNKNWKSLTILNLNRTGLTDEAINILMNTAMPSLRKIHLIGNNFSRNVDRTIQSWTLGNVQVEYDNKKNKIKKLKGIPNNQNN